MAQLRMSPSFNVLLQAVRLDDPKSAEREAARIINSGETDWNDILILSEMHQIRPQVLNLLVNTHSANIPQYVIDKLNDDNRINLLRQLRSLHEFFRIKEALDTRHIKVIPLKGFWLAHMLYGNLGQRESMDVDLYARISDIEAIRTLMIKEGYHPENFFAPYSLRQIIKKFGEYNFEIEEEEITKFHFEFHWAIGSYPYGMRISLEDILDQIISGNIENRELLVFNPSANLLLTVMHHGGKDSLTELKLSYDIALFLLGEIDWHWLIATAKKYDVEKLIYLAVRLASDITGVNVPTQVKRETEAANIRNLSANRIKYMAFSSEERKSFSFMLNDWCFRIRSRTGFKTRIRLLSYIGMGLLTRCFTMALLGIKKHCSILQPPKKK